MPSEPAPNWWTPSCASISEGGLWRRLVVPSNSGMAVILGLLAASPATAQVELPGEVQLLVAAQASSDGLTVSLPGPLDAPGYAPADVWGVATDLGSAGFTVYRATAGRGSHGRAYLVGFDGSRAYPLGGFETVHLSDAAVKLGLKPHGSEMPTHALLALVRLADPFGALDVATRGDSGGAVGDAPALPSDSNWVAGGLHYLRVSARSLRPGFSDVIVPIVYVLAFNAEGRLIAWRCTIGK